MLTQALVGGLFDATDVGTNISTDCGLYNGLSTCDVPVSTYVQAEQSLRISWTCICSVGDDPTVNPVTGACTPCIAGAATTQGLGSVTGQVGSSGWGEGSV